MLYWKFKSIYFFKRKLMYELILTNVITKISIQVAKKHSRAEAKRMFSTLMKNTLIIALFNDIFRTICVIIQNRKC